MIESTSLFAKIGMLIIVVIGFIILFRLGTILLGNFFEIDRTPYLVKGLRRGKVPTTITQDHENENSVPIFRSVDEDKGIEFSWGVWIYIEDVEYLKDQHRHIFHKGNYNMLGDDADSHERKGINYPNNAPGMYLKPYSKESQCSLLIIMNTFTNIYEEIEVPNIPVHKWIHVIIRVENRNVDVYINGMIVARRVLQDVPKQNYGNVYVTQNGGFSGMLSNLQYFNKGINIQTINSIVRKGPNLKSTEDSLKNSSPPYLSMDWFFDNASNSSYKEGYSIF
jgi:hypothetical protein